MADLLAWVKIDWFSIIQTVGIVSGLFYTGITCRQDAKAKEIQNLLAFAERHRTLWTEIIQLPELNRVFDVQADCLVKPPSIAETEALNLIFIHFEMGWRLAKSADRSDLKPLAKDTGHFFSLPLPRAVWEKTKGFRNDKFVLFVERALLKSDTTI